MICMDTQNYDPGYNLAAEEYLLKKTKLECFILYRNEASVIVGKHQNAMAEVNLPYVSEHRIRVVRRITGGGTVYHDPGNLNYSFIRNGEKGKLVDFMKHSRIVMDFLEKKGQEVVFDGRNSLLLGGKKISGTAEHVYHDRVLHHGTILFSADLDRLSGSLNTRMDRYDDRAIKSLRSEVMNLGERLPELDIDGFSGELMDFVRGSDPRSNAGYEFSAGDLEEIGRLVADKYSRWDWNFGYSPKYTFENNINLEGLECTVRFGVERGIIKDLSVSGWKGDNRFPEKLRNSLNGRPHGYRAVGDALRELRPGLQGKELRALVAEFF